MACKKPAPPPTPEEELALPKPVAAAPKAEAPHRCAPLSSEPPFVLGPADTGRTPALKVAPAGSEPGQDDSLPFAAEVGEGVAWSDGFAVGAIHEAESSHSMSVVVLDKTGHAGKVIPLGTAHGDIEPPRVTARGATLLAGVLSPNINGRSLRLAKIEAAAVTWGATILQKSDESQPSTSGCGEKKGIAVWDEDGPSTGMIQASTFDAANASGATTPRTISPPGVDAESRASPRGPEAAIGSPTSHTALAPRVPTQATKRSRSAFAGSKCSPSMRRARRRAHRALRHPETPT